jgi:hypothetical protein
LSVRGALAIGQSNGLEASAPELLLLFPLHEICKCFGQSNEPCDAKEAFSSKDNNRLQSTRGLTPVSQRFDVTIVSSVPPTHGMQAPGAAFTADAAV